MLYKNKKAIKQTEDF